MGNLLPNNDSLLEDHIGKMIAQHQGVDSLPNISFTSVGGGSINHTFQVNAGNKKYFCKVNSASGFPKLFEKEASGLNALKSTQCISTPDVLRLDYLNDNQVLLLQWVDSGLKNQAFWKNFGQRLANLHAWQNPSQPQSTFGFSEDNYMGALPQQNSFMDDWCDFFREKRLEPQLNLAEQKELMPSATRNRFKRLYEKFPQIFEAVPPCLLHGDLWSGNFLCNANAEPVLIDPAVYYGHSGMDLAMTTLFGGFDKQFYDAYNYWRPLPTNYKEQWEVCNLYPLLIHLNLFGSSYLSSIESTLRRFR
jgi:fructosamine-3-kinase